MASRRRAATGKPGPAVPEELAPVVEDSSSWPASLDDAACASENKAGDTTPAFAGAFQAAFFTTVNIERKHSNEDRVMIHSDAYGPRSLPFHLVGVMDGHDTADASEFVSKQLPVLTSYHLKERELTVVQAFRTSCAEIEERLKTQRHPSAGSCVLGCLVAGRHVWCANLGDCRAVVLSLAALAEDAGIKQSPKVMKITWMSEDQRASTPSETARIRKAGGTVTDGRVEGLEPSRTLGDFDVKAMVRPGVISINPEVRRHDLGPEESQALLICATDGVWDTLSGQDMCGIVAARKELLQMQAAALADVRGTSGDGKAADAYMEVLKTLAEDFVTFSVAKGSSDDCTATVALLTATPKGS